MEWKTIGRIQVAPTKHDGVYRRQDGRYWIRARVRDPKTGKTVPFNVTIEATNDDDAARQLLERKNAIREGGAQTKKSPTRFAVFAVSVMEERPRVRSQASKAKWANIVRHLIEDEFEVTYPDKRKERRTFGPMFLDQITHVEARAWRKHLETIVATGTFVVPFANDLIRHFKLIMRIASQEPHSLIAKNFDGLPMLDTSTYDPHPEEDPNSLDPALVKAFCEKARELYPQHFAMIVMAFTFGLRPSTMRPLRRKGERADIDWTTGRLVLRRSQVCRDVVMDKIKTKKKDVLYLPASVLALLKWHVDNLPAGPMRDSDLLFPSEGGGFRARSVLDRPFQVICKALGIKQRLTPGVGPRRTSKDLMRDAGVDHVVGMAMSTHGTEAMHIYYSTVRPDEKRDAAQAVSKLVGIKAKKGAKVIPIARKLTPEPVKTKPMYEINGIVKSLKGWAQESGINASTLHYRLLKGLTMSEAIALGSRKQGQPLPAHDDGGGVKSGVIQSA